MRRLPNDDPNGVSEAELRTPGTFYWGDPEYKDRLFFTCPNRRSCNIPIAPNRNPNGSSWQWDGDRDKPTISPSIDCKGCWHGHIKNGVMRDA